MKKATMARNTSGYYGDDLEWEAMWKTLAQKGLGKYEGKFLWVKGDARDYVLREISTYMRDCPRASNRRLEWFVDSVLKRVSAKYAPKAVGRIRPELPGRAAPRKQANIH